MVIIGAGMGGLAAAMDLAVAGLDVTVVERAAAPGGKMRQVAAGGQPIDAGPTVFTMRWVFDALFDHASASLGDHLRLHPATTLARHAWAGEQQLDLFADRARTADAIGAFAGPAEARGFLAFCEEARRIYDTLERSFLQSERPSMAGLVRSVGVVSALRLRPFETYMGALGRHFRDRRLRQLFGRYATYCGTSPYQAPATLMLVAHVEQEGVWLVEGGMHQVARAMATVASGHGATIRTDTQAAEIVVAGGRPSGVRLASGEVLPAAAVLMNGEPAALASGLLGAGVQDAVAPVHKLPPRSLSATTWAVLAEASGLPLLRHTVFFSGDYPLEFEQIGNGLLPTEPTTYVCAQDRGDSDGDPPTGPERLLLLVNAPATGDRRAFSQVEIDACMAGMSSLMARCGAQIRMASDPALTTPAQWNRLFPASGGALYGQATLPGNSSFKRPGARTRLPGLYLAGGSVHPGAGVPMATLSGRLAAAAIMADLPHRTGARRASTPPSRPRVTAGGMSTR